MGERKLYANSALWERAGQVKQLNCTIRLTSLSIGFERLQYGAMTVTSPRLVLDKPIVWVRDATTPSLQGVLSLKAGKTVFTSGSMLPPSTVNFISVECREPILFQFKGELRAGAIGPVRLNGRWDSERLRGQAWWPNQFLIVFQPLLPPDWKMTLREGSLYAQITFSVAQGKGIKVSGHGVLKGGSAWMHDNKINGVDFILPFRFHKGAWQLGTRGPVSLRIAEIVNQITAKNITAYL